MDESPSKIDFRELLPRLKNHWSGTDIDEWIGIEGDLDHLVGYARVLWPDFVERDGCILRANRFLEKTYRDFMQQTNGNKPAVEAVMNHTHVADLFINAEPKPSRELILHVGRLIKEMWAAKLHRDFPDRRITVSFPEEYCGDLVEYEVTFFQES